MWAPIVGGRRGLFLLVGVTPLTCLAVLVLLYYATLPANQENQITGQQRPANQKNEKQQAAWLLMGLDQADEPQDASLIGAIPSASLSPSSDQQEGEDAELEAKRQSSQVLGAQSFSGGLAGNQSRLAWPERTARIRRLAQPDRRPILNEFSFPANLVQGMRFVLMCQVLDGDLPIQIKWFKDQQELSDGSPMQTELSRFGPSAGELEIELLSNDELGSSLLFRKVQQKHSGNYTCLAKNHLGSTSFSSSLSVKIPPKWRIKPQDQAESIIGQQATIDCQSEGNPNPFIRWKFSPIQQQGAANSLATSATTPEHQNGHLMGPQADTEPQVASSFKLINSNHHVQTLENGSLAIRLVSKDDEGLYLCEADNGLEPSLSKAVRLIVHQQAQVVDDLRLAGSEPAGSLIGALGSPPIRSLRLSQQAPNQEGNATSQPLRVLCQLHGDQPLTVDWLKDDQLIYTHTIGASSGEHLAGPTEVAALAADQRQQLGRLHVNTRRTRPQQQQQHHQQQQQSLASFESELYLTGLRRSDAGVFACSVRNAFGHSERRLKLILQEPPEPPQVVDVGHIGSRSIGLRWLPSGFDGNSPILKYIVEYRRLMGSHADQQQQQQQQQQHGWPDEQLPVDRSTDEPFGQSERIMQQQQQPAQAVATMTTTSTTKAASVGNLDQQQQQQQQQQPILHTVHDLEPLARYSMRVIAVNAVGRSRPSVALALRTEEEVPSVIPSLVGATVLGSRSVRLHWTLTYAPEREIIDGFFIGYRSFDGQTLIQPQQQSSTKSLSSTGLTLQPSQQDGQQQQPTFTYKTVHLSRAPLDQARQQDHLQQDPNSAYISPLASISKSSINPPPQAASNLHNHQQQQQVVSSSFEYIIGGLDRNTEYSILIQCFNKKGAGPTSDPVIFKTFANDPPEKLSLSADEISESSVRVNWRFLLGPASSNAGEKYQLVDGFVLAFAKLITSQQHLRLLASQQSEPTSVISSSSPTRQQPTVSVAAARIATNSNVGANRSQTTAAIDQWQAIQLAPQQRSHQLKNLECGTSYTMKIWAFNKIGKGEPSDPLTVSTRGKAPIAPDRRSFLSINSTQVRLHLSAWYDGGCEIDKFIVQYRLRGHREWTLVSNNILREQLSVLIRDLVPATSYELSIGAQNQVGLTEVKYRFITLDLEGKQVVSLEANSFASSSPDGPELVVDYSDGDSGMRREFWPASSGDQNSSLTRSLLVMRQFMNSPMALVLSLCFFVLLLMVMVFYKFNGQADQSSPSMSTLNLNSGHKSASGGRNSGPEPNLALMSDPELIGHGGTNTNSGSGCSDSPARMSTFHRQHQQHHSIRLLDSASNNNNSCYSPIPESCHYQPFCNPLAIQQQQHLQQPSATPPTTSAATATATGLEYSHYGLPQASAYEAVAGNNIYSAGLPLQRSATMEQVNQPPLSGGTIMMDQDHGSRQLIQMLMLQGQNQAHLNQIAENPGQQLPNSYAATIARGGACKLVIK